VILLIKISEPVNSASQREIRKHSFSSGFPMLSR
jgi:hypothetical protein